MLERFKERAGELKLILVILVLGILLIIASVYKLEHPSEGELGLPPGSVFGVIKDGVSAAFLILYFFTKIIVLAVWGFVTDSWLSAFMVIGFILLVGLKIYYEKKYTKL